MDPTQTLDGFSPGAGEKRMRRSVRSLLTSLLLALCCAPATGKDRNQNELEHLFTVRPIGYVRKTDSAETIVLNEKYRAGLLGLDGFSHVYVLWWFDRSDTPEKRAVLQVHPRANLENPLTGVFATRAPVRPNMIALTLCKIVSVTGNVVEVDEIDAFDGTPVLDMKPYLPGEDDGAKATGPDWLDR